MLNTLTETFRKFLISWSSVKKLNKIDNQEKSIVFYTENFSDWSYFNGIINELNSFDISVIKTTSAYNATANNKDIYYLGSGSALTYFFKTLKFKAIVMTLTDLNTFHLKKSMYPVHYFYIFHSLVSTHRAYREKAFDAYDSILCSGQYQIDEIRKTEKVYNLNKKNLYKHGYGKLDSLIHNYNLNQLNKNNNLKKINILIAPTWGIGSIFGYLLDEIISLLLKSEFVINLRLHPMTERYKKKEIAKILEKNNSNINFSYNKNIESHKDMINSDVMISDWSGVAMEYAFATKNPVIFIDTKPKVRNNNWKKINMPCLEEKIRDKIGKIVSEDNLDDLPNIIKDFVINKSIWKQKINDTLKKTIFNISNSDRIGATIIYESLKQNNDQ